MTHIASDIAATRGSITLDQATEDAIAQGLPIACGVSGGIDGAAAALLMWEHLRKIGAKNELVLIHFDAGTVEWADSVVQCRELAAHMGVDLIVVGEGEDLMMRTWSRRWELGVARYQELRVVNVIAPWSSASQRFCTSVKVQKIKSALGKRWPKQPYINITGVRWDESRKRAAMSVSDMAKKGKKILNSRPAIALTKPQAFAEVIEAGLRPHDGYAKHGSTRVSCSPCVLSNFADLVSSAAVPEHAGVFQRLIEMELSTSFSFQSGRWLMDVATHVMTPAQIERMAYAKERAAKRKQLEALVPEDLLFTKGWPHRLPTPAEAEVLAHVRKEVSALYGFTSLYTDAASLRARYEQLMIEKPQDADGDESDAEAPAAPVKLADLVGKQMAFAL